MAGAGGDRYAAAGLDRRRAATIRRQVWALIEARHGRIPPSRVADTDLGPTIVIRMDATIPIAHSAKEQATGTFKAPLRSPSATAWCDNTPALQM